jgi:hypothetical protein
MAAHKSTINLAKGPGTASSKALPLKWSSFDSGANNLYFDVNNVDASKMIILALGHTTLINNWWIGTSDSRDSAANDTAQYPFSAGQRGRMKIASTVQVKADAAAKFLTTVVADTEVKSIWALGPFETARFKDSDGYINMCRGKVTAGQASHSSDEQHVCAILLP